MSNHYIFVYKTGKIKLFRGQLYTKHLKMIGDELETIILPDHMQEYRGSKWINIEEVNSTRKNTKATIRCIRIDNNEDPFDLYRRGELSKGKLIEIIIDEI